MARTKSKNPRGKTAGISDEAVRAKTGKTWAEWIEILDAAGAAKMTHKEIVAVVRRHQRAGGWWDQMVTVGYEQARGLREAHETPKGYQVSVSRTIAVPVGALYASWKDNAARKRWLGGEAVTIRRATPRKSMRMTWVDGKSSVDVNFYSKGRSKSQVVVGHTKLTSAAEVIRTKTFWSKRLDGLKRMLES